MLSGSPALARIRLKSRKRFRGSSGVPIRLVKIKPMSHHSLPAANRSRIWCARCARSAVSADGGSAIVRLINKLAPERVELDARAEPNAAQS